MPVENCSRRIARFNIALSGLLFAALLFIGNAAVAAPVKIAFTGDQGVGEHAQAVLSLVASEGTDLLMIQGDLGYKDGSAAAWEANLSNALGKNFPVLTLVGNHENFEWPLYQQLIAQRIARADGLNCSGEVGVKALCRYGNIEIVQVSPGITEIEGVKPDDNYAQFITSSFADSNAPWRICSWHKNQSKMQTGEKSDATGWDVYDACLDVGAMIALAHEHAYSRTHLLSDYRNQTVVHKNNDLTLEPGHSFAFVSGLGGREVRPQMQGGDWWASIYTATQDATHGALFCTFEDTSADCYFKAIDGAVPDQFSLKSSVLSGSDQVVDTVVANESAELGVQDESADSVAQDQSIEPDEQDESTEPSVTDESGTIVITTSSNNVEATSLAEMQTATPPAADNPDPPPPQDEVTQIPAEIDQSGVATTPPASSDQIASSPLDPIPVPVTTVELANSLTVNAESELPVEQSDQRPDTFNSGGSTGSGSLSIFGLLLLIVQIGRKNFVA